MLPGTLNSVRTEDVDGLNFLYQVPLALPWAALPIGVWTTYTQYAWILAGCGLVNAVILRVLLARRAKAIHDGAL